MSDTPKRRRGAGKPFEAGVSGNRSGRPAGFKGAAVQLQKRMAVKEWAKLVTDAARSEDPITRRWGLDAYADRVLGRPLSPLDMTVTTTQATIEPQPDYSKLSIAELVQFNALYEKAAGNVQAPAEASTMPAAPITTNGAHSANGAHVEPHDLCGQEHDA